MALRKVNGCSQQWPTADMAKIRGEICESGQQQLLHSYYLPILQRGKLRLRKIESWAEVALAATVTIADGIFGACYVPKHFTHSPRADHPMELLLLSRFSRVRLCA